MCSTVTVLRPDFYSMEEKLPIKLRKPRINWFLVPIKLHYALFWGGTAAAVLFMPLLAKQAGIHASAVGVIYTGIAITSLLSQPGFGAISDHFQNSKAVLMTLVTITAITLYSLLHIPPIQQAETLHDISVACSNNNFNIYPSENYNSSCLSSVLEKGDICKAAGKEKLPTTVCQQKNKTTPDFEPPAEFHNRSGDVNCYNFRLEKCSNQTFNWVSCNSSLNLCFINRKPVEINVYKTYQFWLFAALSIAGIALTNTCYSLSDSMCYELLGENTELFGNQRLWSTCSYGLASFLAGYLNDATAEESSPAQYKMGFYVMLAMLFLDLIVLSRTKATNVTISKFSLRDVGLVLVNFDVIIFAIGVFVIGIFTAMFYNYQFWFLQDIGASQTLLGIMMLAQNDIADLIFFLVSGRIIQSLGHLYCLSISFLGFFGRFLLYFLLPNPWYMLPVEILDGVTFSVFYVTMTSFAKINAQPGTEATMVGVLVGLYSGLGAAVGSLLGGVSIDNLGGRYTFLSAAAASLLFSLVFFIIKLSKHRSKYIVKSLS